MVGGTDILLCVGQFYFELIKQQKRLSCWRRSLKW